MVDFSKHKHGDVVVVHCCDECARKAGVNPKRPADSGKASWLCDVCGHHGIGSLTDCEIGDWLRLRPLQPNTAGKPQPQAVGLGGLLGLVPERKVKKMTAKQKVLKKYPGATASMDVDGFWWVRPSGELRALNDARRPVRSAAAAWKKATERVGDA